MNDLIKIVKKFFGFWQIEEKVKELDGVIKDLENKRDQESGSVMQKLEAALADKQKVEAVAQSAVDVKKEGLKAENKKKKELTKNIQDVGFLILNPNEVFRLNRIK